MQHNKNFYVPPSGPPQISPPQIFAKIGFEKLHRMVWQQYQELARSAIAHMFPKDERELRAAAQRNAEFLCGILGGPKIYQKKYGPPQMRQRHMPFAIDEAARQEWLRCYQNAFEASDRLELPPEEQHQLLAWIENFSAWMVNRK